MAEPTLSLRDTQKPMSESEIQDMYRWTGREPDCPDDLVVNASNQTMIVSAQQQLPYDNPRIDPGDRRRGDYYVRLKSRHSDFSGLQRVKDLPIERLVELEQQRKLRSGDEPADWVKEAWAKMSPEHKAKLDPRYRSKE